MTRAVFINAGRSTRAKVEAAWHLVADQLDEDKSEILLAVEVDEGDRGYSDHGFIRRLIRLRRRVFKGHEVILTRGPGWSNPHTYRAGRSVKHWSPARPVSSVDHGGDVRYFVLHPAAGTVHQRSSQRPSWARPLLNASWEATITVLVREIERASELGMSSVVMLDANDRDFVHDLRELLSPRLRKALVVLFADAPDFALAFPARGMTVTHTATTHAQPIERIHSIHTVDLDFTKETR